MKIPEDNVLVAVTTSDLGKVKSNLCANTISLGQMRALAKDSLTNVYNRSI